MPESYEDIMSDPLAIKVADVILRHLCAVYVQTMQHEGSLVMSEPYVCPYDGLPPHVQIFLHELEGLCMTHKLSLASSGYDALQIWDWHSGEDALNFQNIENRTTNMPQ